MCGRFTLRTPAKDIASLFDLHEVPDLRPRYNIAPSQPIATVRLNPAKQRELFMLRWGLVPFWADDPKTGYKMINARAETVASKPSFRRPFQERRCLIIADGYFEWQKTDGKKQPHFFHRKDDRPFAFAGLWEHWQRADDEIESCAIIVTEANEVQQPIHDRMPVILREDAYDRWLDPDARRQDLESLLIPYPDNDLLHHPVSTIVNSPKNDVEQCVERSEETS
jgi:putative SOS response-associated peptidase YedK